MVTPGRLRVEFGSYGLGMKRGARNSGGPAAAAISPINGIHNCAGITYWLPMQNAQTSCVWHSLSRPYPLAIRTGFMARTPGKPLLGKTINHGGRVRLYLDGKLHAPRFPRGWWWGTALDYRTELRYRVVCPDWLPIGAVLVCDSRRDVDCFEVNLHQTQLENAIPQEWIDAHRPGGDGGQLMLLMP